MKKQCEICGAEFETVPKGHTRKYCFTCQPSNSRQDRFDNPSNANLVAKAMRKEAIKRKGGKCEICGYNKCEQALDFHHLDPSEKEFDISGNTKRNWQDYLIEIQKCQLVCSNCHREIHSDMGW